MKAYAVKDEATEYFNSPFFLNTHGEAIRGFGTQAQDATTMIGTYPKDYSLWYLGDYDKNNGEMIPTVPERIARATDFIKTE